MFEFGQVTNIVQHIWSLLTYLSITWSFPDPCQTTAWQLLDNCPTFSWQLPDSINIDTFDLTAQYWRNFFYCRKPWSMKTEKSFSPIGWARWLSSVISKYKSGYKPCDLLIFFLAVGNNKKYYIGIQNLTHPNRWSAKTINRENWKNLIHGSSPIYAIYSSLRS